AAAPGDRRDGPALGLAPRRRRAPACHGGGALRAGAGVGPGAPPPPRPRPPQVAWLRGPAHGADPRDRDRCGPPRRTGPLLGGRPARAFRAPLRRERARPARRAP